jgi:hypothetical protein
MIMLRLILFCTSAAFLVLAAGLVVYDIYLAFELDRILRPSPNRRSPNAAAPPKAGQTPSEPALPRPRRAIQLRDAA